MTQELIRRIDNVVQLGKVCEIKSDKGKALARVDIHGRVTDFLPVFLWNSDFVKVWIPIRVGQQVSVLCPYGNANFGIVLPGIYHKNNKESEGANEKNIIIEIDPKNPVRILIEDGKVQVEAAKKLSFKALSINFDGEVSISKNLRVAKSIYDELGDLTHHGHPR